jgi:P4 family phage/plasmid primase-like protien
MTSRSPHKGGSSGPLAPRQPPGVNGSSQGVLKNVVEIKDGLVIIALTPFLRAKIATLSGDPVGEILECFEDRRLEEALGLKYEVYVCRIRGECVEARARSERFIVWCRDLWEHLRPDVVGPTKFELEWYLKNIPFVDPPGRAITWVERLVEVDKELSKAESEIVSKLVGLEGEASKAGEGGLCLEGLFTLEDGKPAPLPSYAFKCAERLVEIYNVRLWYDNLYVHINGRWIGEPDSLDLVLRPVMERSYAKLELHRFNWKYSSFRREVEAVLHDRAPRAEPVKGVRSGDYLIIWGDSGYEIRPYGGEFVIHDINARVKPELLDVAKAKGYNARQLAEAEASVLVEILKSWVGDPYWVTLEELISYTTIAFRYPFNKAFMLLGSGSNGKSTFIRMLKDILGRHNVTSVPLEAFTSLDYRFLWSGLVGKLANVFADIPTTPLKYTGVFKILTGEDCINFDRKGKEPIQCYTNYAKLVFSANELPKTGDTSRAFFRRWVLIDFRHTFPDDPTWYDRNIRPELRDIALTIGLEAMREVLERKAFTGEADIRERWLEESDQVYRFIKELERLGLAKRDPNGRVPAKDLYMVYSRWARIEGVEVLAQARLTSELEKYGIMKRDIYYTGIRLLERPDVIVAKLEGEGSREGLEAYQ